MQEGGIYPYLFRILRPAILACRGLRRALRGLRRLLRGRAGSGDVMAEAAPATTPGVLARFGYELEGLLGHCVYGKVYRARARQGHAQVAIKVISKKKATQQYLRELLPRHIQAVILKLLCPASERLSAQELLHTSWVSRFLLPDHPEDLSSATTAPKK
uniref:Testis-specific serine/threonine-protein kinase 4-like n=1 Tax=Nothoprocta perdicaria TaxID=30464 RepID=A0A8C6YVA7_NOTPE